MAGQEFHPRVRRTALLTVGLSAAPILVLVGGDWVPGMVIVVASLAGLVEQVLVIRRLCGRDLR